ncbi:MAG: sugar transferase [Acidobacteria bacterium]|nr:sugar transferase [Acidobacteriota bacterium]
MKLSAQKKNTVTPSPLREYSTKPEPSRRLHIAFFNRSFYPEAAATGQLLTELCESLVQDYHCRVTVISGIPLQAYSAAAIQTIREGWVLKVEKYRGVEIIRARGTRFSKNRFAGRLSNYLTYFLSACYAGLRLESPDVIVALTDPPIIGLAAWISSRRFSCPLVLSFRDVFPEVARLLEDFQSEFVNKILDQINRFLLQRAHRVVALGETMRRRLIDEKGSPAENTLVIPDWADCSEIRPAVKNNIFTCQNNLQEKFVVMHSGNIGLSQGLESVVRSARLLEKFPEIEMVFVGGGVKQGLLEVQVQQLGLKNVRFIPFQPRELLRDSFASADVFIISLKSGLAGYIVPSKLYGILAAGRTYVAAVEPECEVSLITRRYDCGLLARPENEQDIAAKILELYQKPELRRRLADNARRAALEFDRPLQVKAYYELFQQIARPQRSCSLLKRSFDIGLSGLGLLITAPLWIVIAICIKLTDGGPVFYSQNRIGRDGKRFKSWKFRSMVPDADKLAVPLQASKGDVRVTAVGRILRATAGDELPQLWNIFRGDMSFVGPRPLAPVEIETRAGGKAVPQNQIPGFKERHMVRPGLTGLAQVYAPRDLPRRNKFRLDVLYVRKRSFFLDLKLIAFSIWISLRGKWEHQGKKL